MAQLHSDLSEFVGLLNSRGVEYVVVGGHAVAFHGYPRFTGDIDFLIRADRVNAERVIGVLQEFGFGNVGLKAEDLTKPDQVVQLGRPPNRIDLLSSISGVSFDSAWESCVLGALGEHQVRYLGFEALLQNKIASGRDKDQLDVKVLRRIAASKRS